LSLDNENIKVYIERIIKGPPSDDVWSVDAKVWVESSDDGKKHVKPVRVNVLKDDGYFEEDGDGTLKLLKRLKDCYKRNVIEDEDFDGLNSESFESEREMASKLEGEEFKV